MVQGEKLPGLTDPEKKMYLELLKLKMATARELSKATGSHRTNIYDVMEKLKEKGLVSFHKQDNVTWFHVTNPKNLYNYLEESKKVIDKVLPKLQDLYSQKYSETSVEVFKGKQGVISAYNDILYEKKEICAFSISRMMKEKLPIYREQFVKSIIRLKIPYRLIYTRRVSSLPKPIKMKFTKEEFISPIEVQIYGDKVLQVIWEPDMMAILIKNKNLADMYRKQFELLWAIAKE